MENFKDCYKEKIDIFYAIIENAIEKETNLKFTHTYICS